VNPGTDPANQVEFLRKLQRLLDEGSFVATYKFALLHAIADICVEKPVVAADPVRISIGELAVKVIGYYWQQVLPYKPNGARGGILAQNSGRQAAILQKLRDAQGTYGSNVITAARDRRNWKNLVSSVARTIKEMPLWKLQTLGGVNQVDEFLYRKANFNASPRSIVEQTIELNAGVPEAFRAFHGMVVNMIRGGWVKTMRGMARNRQLLGHSDDLFEFLFDKSRTNLAKVGAMLKDYQQNQCFYCRKEIAGQGEVDHFVPWSRYPNDLAHNLVLAHTRCNADKRDYLAAEAHLNHWAESRLDETILDEDFLALGVGVDKARARHIARWAYEQAEFAQAHCWMKAKQFQPIGDRWRYILPV
jgi:hypothetical protein